MIVSLTLSRKQPGSRQVPFISRPGLACLGARAPLSHLIRPFVFVFYCSRNLASRNMPSFPNSPARAHGPSGYGLRMDISA